MMSKLVLCLALATAVRANDFEVSEEYVYGEPRLLDGVFNNTSIDLNSILALVLIAILALVTIGPNFLGGGGTGYGYNRNGYEQYNDYYDYNNQQQFYKRAGQFDSDVAGKMAQLEQAFKKYQDRKSTRLNPYITISYAVFCLKKKKTYIYTIHIYNIIPIILTVYF